MMESSEPVWKSVSSVYWEGVKKAWNHWASAKHNKVKWIERERGRRVEQYVCEVFFYKNVFFCTVVWLVEQFQKPDLLDDEKVVEAEHLDELGPWEGCRMSFYRVIFCFWIRLTFYLVGVMGVIFFGRKNFHGLRKDLNRAGCFKNSGEKKIWPKRAAILNALCNLLVDRRAKRRRVWIPNPRWKTARRKDFLILRRITGACRFVSVVHSSTPAIFQSNMECLWDWRPRYYYLSPGK